MDGYKHNLCEHSQSAQRRSLRRAHHPFALPSTRHGLSLIEVLAVIGVILLLLSLLFPSMRKAQAQAHRIACTNNLKQWGHALQYYREEHNDYLPTEGTFWSLNKPYTWFNVLPPYLGAPSYKDVERKGKLIKEFPSLHIWICPSKYNSLYKKSGSGQNQFHYGMNQVIDGVSDWEGMKDFGDNPTSARQFDNQAKTVFMFDIFWNSPAGMQESVGTSYHGDFANVLFLDGRVNNFSERDFITYDENKQKERVWRNPDLFWGFIPKEKHSIFEFSDPYKDKARG